MKRRALLIGCPWAEGSPDFLPGVKTDMRNYLRFLQSENGGEWYQNEITVLYDKSLSEVLSEISRVREESNDFVFVIFSGHGLYSKSAVKRILCINDKDEIIKDELIGLSNKQLTIIDTCAGYESELIAESASVESEQFLSYKINYRGEYERLIAACAPQQLILYSCSEGESSIETSEGGAYLKSLLDAGLDYKSGKPNALEIHSIAAEVVARKTNNSQNPDYFCSARFGAKLPFSIY